MHYEVGFEQLKFFPCLNITKFPAMGQPPKTRLTHLRKIAPVGLADYCVYFLYNKILACVGSLDTAHTRSQLTRSTKQGKHHGIFQCTTAFF